MTVGTTKAAATERTIEKTVGGKRCNLTHEQAEAFGRELDALKERRRSPTSASATPPTSGG